MPETTVNKHGDLVSSPHEVGIAEARHVSAPAGQSSPTELGCKSELGRQIPNALYASHQL
jgi:hypothetical protein